MKLLKLIDLKDGKDAYINLEKLIAVEEFEHNGVVLGSKLFLESNLVLESRQMQEDILKLIKEHENQ